MKEFLLFTAFTFVLTDAVVSVAHADEINAWAVPTAEFTATTVCQGLQTVFTNNSFTPSGSIVAHIWDFGDGLGSTVFSPSHTYASSGTFSVTLTVINSQGDVDDYTDVVTVHPSGNLNFLIASTNNCVSSIFTFTNLSNVVSGNIATYSWDFGDSQSASTSNTTHQYASFGTYEVTLTTTTNNNCTKSFSKTLEVYPEASVDFNASNVCVDKSMQFSNLTTVGSGIVTYGWNYGDTNSSVEVNPTHEYASANTWSVVLTATTEKGCITSKTKQVITFPVPVVDFDVAAPCLGTSANFANNSTIAGGVLSYAWTFGDGDGDTDSNPSHLYDVVGNFNVTLTATSVQGCEGVASQFVYVSPKPIVDFSFDNVCAGLATKFANNTLIAEGTVNYAWNFGDTETSTSVSPSHSYDSFGTYDVTLTAVASSGGCSDQITKTVQVLQQPHVQFSADDVCLSQPTTFVNGSNYDGNDISYAWDLGNGATSIVANPSITYAAPQTYQVTLKATAANGCADTFSKQVKVNALPQTNFSAAGVCLGSSTVFSNLSSISSGTIRYNWSFGDGGTSNDQEPSQTYQTPGDYVVTLTATSDANCAVEKKKVVFVYPMPVSNFDAPNVCDGQSVAFKNQSSVSGGALTEFKWDFGDQTNSIVTHPTKDFLKEGTYFVKLVSLSDKGCKSEVTKPIIVHARPVANFSVNDVCSTDAVQVSNLSKISSGNLNYRWDFGDKNTSAAASPSHLYADFGVYNIQLTVSSEANCRDSVARAVAVFGRPEIKAAGATTVSKGRSAQLEATGGVEYRWEPIDGLNNSNIANPIATPLITTEYTVFAKDKYGCENTARVTVTVDEDFSLVASNILTPDGNGQNDTWVVNNIETYGEAIVRVYDRAGKLVFHRENYRNDWQGYSGTDVLPDGTYYYYITFANNDAVYKGALTILRNQR